jgi:hypothetical protein
MVNTGHDPCNKVTSCVNPKDGTNVICNPNKKNGDYLCQVKNFV